MKTTIKTNIDNKILEKISKLCEKRSGVFKLSSISSRRISSNKKLKSLRLFKIKAPKIGRR